MHLKDNVRSSPLPNTKLNFYIGNNFRASVFLLTEVNFIMYFLIESTSSKYNFRAENTIILKLSVKTQCFPLDINYLLTWKSIIMVTLGFIPAQG